MSPAARQRDCDSTFRRRSVQHDCAHDVRSAAHAREETSSVAIDAGTTVRIASWHSSSSSTEIVASVACHRRGRDWERCSGRPAADRHLRRHAQARQSKDPPRAPRGDAPRRRVAEACRSLRCSSTCAVNRAAPGGRARARGRLHARPRRTESAQGSARQRRPLPVLHAQSLRSRSAQARGSARSHEAAGRVCLSRALGGATCDARPFAWVGEAGVFAMAIAISQPQSLPRRPLLRH